MREGFNQLDDKLALADQGQDEKAAELHTYADKISSELEMAEANSKQENDELHDRLDKEIKSLTVKFTDQLNQALEKLTQMSSDLNSTIPIPLSGTPNNHASISRVDTVKPVICREAIPHLIAVIECHSVAATTNNPYPFNP